MSIEGHLARSKKRFNRVYRQSHPVSGRKESLFNLTVLGAKHKKGRGLHSDQNASIDDDMGVCQETNK
jgi:hypothetical protein